MPLELGAFGVSPFYRVEPEGKVGAVLDLVLYQVIDATVRFLTASEVIGR